MKLHPKLLLLQVVILAGALSDLPARFRYGGLSLQAFLTIFCVTAIWPLIFMRLRISRRLLLLWPFPALLCFGFLSFFWYPFNTRGIQNLLVITLFLGLVIFSEQVITRHPEYIKTIEKTVEFSFVIGAALYALSVLKDGLDASSIMGSRSYALSALIGISWFAAKWQAGDRKSLFWALGLIALIGVSLYRMALIVALALLPVAQFRLRSIRKWLIAGTSIAIAGGIFIALLMYYPPVRDRFLTGDMSFQVGGLAINAMGRTAFWSTTIQSFIESPIIGKGSGSVVPVIHTVNPAMDHPHNDYLRLLHDYGLIGLTLWLVGFISITWRTWNAWEKKLKAGSSLAHIHLAAALSLIAVALTMVTDNTMVYFFVMAPTAVLTGTSISVMAWTYSCEAVEHTSRSDSSLPSAASTSATVH